MLFSCITGYTTNFKKNFLDFFFSSLKSLIIPAFCFSIITCLLYGLLFQDLYFIHLFLKKEYWGTGFLFFWFLNALFLSRLFCWVLVKYVKYDILGGGILLVLMLLGVFWASSFKENPTYPTYHNPFYIHHAMYLAIYMWLGKMAKQYHVDKKNYFAIMSILFVLLLFLIKLCGEGIIPTANYKVNFDISILNLLLAIFAPILGTSFLIFISQMLGKNKIFEFFGKNSLVVYVTHFIVIRYLLYFANPILDLNESRLFGLSYTIFIYVVTCVICAILIQIFNNTKIKFLIGKF